MFKTHYIEIMSYEVDLKNHKIIMHTEYNDCKLIEITDIDFCDVLAHFLRIN